MTAGLRQAVGFLTPLGGARPPTPAAVAWFPVVGLGMGLALGGVWSAGDGVWAPAVAAAVVVAADLALTGLLHLDGLVDSADGLLPHMSSPERRLEVMRRPDAGAFGVGAAGVVLLLRWSALATIVPSALLLAALWCLSRTAMALAALRLTYARAGGGLASAFLPAPPASQPAPAPAPARTRTRAGAAPPPASRVHSPRFPGAMYSGAGGVGVGGAGVVLALGAAVLWDPVAGPVALLAAGAGAGAVLLLAQRRVGGFTGDVLGAAGLVGETCGLVAAAGSW